MPRLFTAVLDFARKLPELIRLSFFPLGITLRHLHSLHSCLGTCYSLIASALGVVCGVFLASGLGMDIDFFFRPSSCTFSLSTFYLAYNLKSGIEKVEDNVARNEDNARKKEDARSIDSSIWADCAFMDKIDLNAIIVNETPKHNLAYQYIDHIIEEKGPCNLNGDEQPMKLDSLIPIKCINVNADGGDEVVDLNADGGDRSDEGVNIENIIDLNFDGGDKVNIESFINLNVDGGSDERVNKEPSSQTNSFDLNFDSGDDADNTIFGSPALQLALSKYDELKAAWKKKKNPTPPALESATPELPPPPPSHAPPAEPAPPAALAPESESLESPPPTLENLEIEIAAQGEDPSGAGQEDDDGGPIDKSVLRSFKDHIAYAIWNREEAWICGDSAATLVSLREKVDDFSAIDVSSLILVMAKNEISLLDRAIKGAEGGNIFILVARSVRDMLSSVTVESGQEDRRKKIQDTSTAPSASKSPLLLLQESLLLPQDPRMQIEEPKLQRGNPQQKRSRRISLGLKLDLLHYIFVWLNSDLAYFFS
ncbi:hypothetical protein LguiA_013068 [Lonicera macranthoides]